MTEEIIFISKDNRKQDARIDDTYERIYKTRDNKESSCPSLRVPSFTILASRNPRIIPAALFFGKRPRG